MAKKDRKLSKARRTALSVAAKKRHARERGEAPQHAARKAAKNGQAPGGIRVLVRHGNGKDVVECNANEVIEAMRIMRQIKKILYY